MTTNPNYRAVHAFVDELSKAGVRHVCISPGSRSTPLTMSIAAHGGFQIFTLLDERSSGFFAVGLARRLDQPVALVCTSGTAAANYHPAVMEACQSRIPLVVLTADRPPELHDIGSNQTVRQFGLYGEHVKWSVNMPVPGDTSALKAHAAATAWRAVAHATTSPAGPVHVNWPFRDPLVPSPRDTADDGHRGGLQSFTRGTMRLDDAAALQLFQMWQSAERPLVVLGPQEDRQVAQIVAALAQATRTPLLADGLSQVRTIGADGALSSWIVDAYDWFVEGEFPAQPDFILRLGRTPTSKGLGQYLSSASIARQVVVDVHAGWTDAAMAATDVVVADTLSVVQALLELAKSDAGAGYAGNGRDNVHSKRESWGHAWAKLNETVRQLVEQEACADLAISAPNDEVWAFEGRIWTELVKVVPDGTNLFSGNSMPVRDLDGFLPAHPASLAVYANRGVSGIDGVISSAAGTAAGAGEPTVLVIGDVSFHHDTNGLYAAFQYHLPLVVVLVHNDGGGIFTGLPQAEHQDTFTYFQTPHGMDYRGIVETFQGTWVAPDSWDAFRRAVVEGLRRSGLTVVQLRTSGPGSTEIRRKIRTNAKDIASDWVF